MLSIQRARRSKFFSPMTPGWIVGVLLFAAAVLFTQWANRTLGIEFSICPMQKVLGKPCPLCGGTRASLQLAGGEFVAAFKTNPLVTLSLLAYSGWSLLWLGLGIRIATTLRTPVVATLILLILAINWAYILSINS